MLRGRCRHCGSKFSPRYLWGELLTALVLVHVVLFAYVAELSVLHGVLLAAALIILLFISLYDMRHMVVPMVPLALFLAIALMYAVTRPTEEALSHVLAGVVFGAFFLVLFTFSRGKWVGGGDAPVALGIGMLVGPVPALLTLIFASYLGTFIYLISRAKEGIVRMVYSRHESSLSLESEIPFVPLLFGGAILASWTAPIIIAFIWP
jgi:prepilin signal peptidase PulO-like enzyme (type II secretory pathway)